MITPKVIKVRTANNDFQHLEVLKRNRNKRHQYKRFIVEGVRPINRMVEHNWTVYAFIYSAQKRLSKWAMDILRKTPAQFHYELSPELMAQLSSKEDSSELLALVKQTPDQLTDIKLSKKPLIVVCDRPANPGNLGTIMRSCDSFRVDGLIVTGHSADIYDPVTIRASVGSCFALSTIRVPSVRDLELWFANLNSHYPNLQIIGTSAKTSQLVSQCNFHYPTVLLIGNETAGLSNHLKNLCHKLVKIPLHGTASSLNVACATSICLYEVDRQRGDSAKIELNNRS